MNSSSGYLMDDPRETSRLSQKVDAAEWVRKFIVPLELAGATVLDVGCGPAVIASEISQHFPTASVTGLDQSEERLVVAQQNNLENLKVQLVSGSAAELPFGDASFDFVMCRFLLEYLPDKQAAINEMVRVLRPGGRLLLQDLDGQLLWHFPIDEDLQRNIESTLKVLAKTGFDPFVGRKLFHFSKVAGLDAINVRIEPYHQIIGQIDNRMRALWELKLDIALPAAAKALGSPENAVEMKRHFLAYFDREDSLTYSVVFTVVARKPVRPDPIAAGGSGQP